MIDVAAIQGGLAGLKTAGDIIKGLFDLNTTAEVQTEAIKLQSIILTAYSEQAAMIQRVRDLEEEIVHMKTWEETKQRYQLISPWPGRFLYARKKPTGEPFEPPHWICAKCYENGRKSILHFVRKGGDGLRFSQHCPTCDLFINQDFRGPPDIKYADETPYSVTSTREVVDFGGG